MERIPGSFRDPSGFLFMRDGFVYRQVNISFKEHFDHLVNSGLYDRLVQAGLLIPHDEVEIEALEPDKAYTIIRPEMIEFVSYPYEWCFSQLKDAALTTLEVQKAAAEFGMSLKDCSAYNIQFHRGKPVFIDTLSFERYREGSPWVAYRQFCQHFLAPLALMSHRDVRLSQLLTTYIDGVPLDLCSKILPFRTRLSFSLLSHVHIHARFQQRFADRREKPKQKEMSRNAFLGLIDSLESGVAKLKWRPQGTQWGDYYEDTNYTPEAHENKKRLVGEFLERISPEKVLDLGANTGLFSRIAVQQGVLTVSCDVDPAAVETNYLQCRDDNEKNILPLIIDLTNPSPSIGWENEERMSLLQRNPVDTVMALALVHHLAISNNVPLPQLARFFGRACSSLIIEFVPKSDSQVQRLLSTRDDVFPDYTRERFEASFSQFFRIVDSQGIVDTERTLYLMERKS